MDLHVILYFERCKTIYASPSNVSNTLFQENQNTANVLYRSRCNKSVLVADVFGSQLHVWQTGKMKIKLTVNHC